MDTAVALLPRRGRVCLVGALLAAVPALAAPARFVEVTLEAGIDFRYVNGATEHKYLPECMGSGAAFFDYDSDGHLDLFIVNGAYLDQAPPGDPPVDALYRNRGDGTFADVTRTAGVGDPGYGMGAAVGDYDNDGDPDLYVTNYGPNTFYRNQGDGTFADVTRTTGTGDAGWGTNAAFVDYDRDGDLDLYVANYMDFLLENNQECRQGKARAYCAPTTYPGQSGALYRNRGDGTFADVTRQAGLYSTAGRQLGAVFGDYDNDGDPDLFVANDKTPNFLFRNEGNGTFAEVSTVAGVAYNENGMAESAMGADWGDSDNDGYLDLIVATFQWPPNTLYHNEGDGFFMDATDASGIGRERYPGLGMAPLFLDYDNDGHLDLFVANGHLDPNVQEYDPAATYAQKNQLFRNQGDGTFAEITDQAGPGLQLERVSHGAAYGDYDNDGDVDIFVSDSDTPHCTLLRNDGGSASHYLMIRTVGSTSNRDGIGTRIEVKAGDLTQIREVRSTSGYLSASDLRVHFGLGPRARADRVELRWPSGAVQVLQDVAADQLLVVREPGTAPPAGK
jgi:enediyne biosynthesis protein E4